LTKEQFLKNFLVDEYTSTVIHPEGSIIW
jgi:hypothetical protein